MHKGVRIDLQGNSLASLSQMAMFQPEKNFKMLFKKITKQKLNNCYLVVPILMDGRNNPRY
jgi:hypothetical protein